MNFAKELKSKMETIELEEDVVAKANKNILACNNDDDVRRIVTAVKSLQSRNYEVMYENMLETTLSDASHGKVTDAVYTCNGISIRTGKPFKDAAADYVLTRIAHMAKRDAYAISIYEKLVTKYIDEANLEAKYDRAGFVFVQGIKDNSIKDVFDRALMTIEMLDWLDSFKEMKKHIHSIRVKVGFRLMEWSQ